jgi:LemA protein
MESFAYLAIIVVVAVACFYNMLVSRRNQVENAAASIDVYLKLRFELIPNLVAAVQSYMKYEHETLKELTELRTRAMAPNIPDTDKIAIEARMTGMMGDIRAAVENYPELKASGNFVQLQGAINDVEEKIAAARRNFNCSVTDFNNAVQMFPTDLFARVMGLKVRPLFSIPESEKQNPDAKLLFSR